MLLRRYAIWSFVQNYQPIKIFCNSVRNKVIEFEAKYTSAKTPLNKVEANVLFSAFTIFSDDEFVSLSSKL